MKLLNILQKCFMSPFCTGFPMEHAEKVKCDIKHGKLFSTKICGEIILKKKEHLIHFFSCNYNVNISIHSYNKIIS